MLECSIVHEVDHWLTMRDGVRLHATLWRPDGDGPWPALLEALPYRKDDLTASYADHYRDLVDGGYGVARLDLRGTGSSEGIATDEYPPEEQADLAEVIAWLAAQPWSSGAVGMFGTSYSGFNSLQVAAERPPALRAICAIYATDDRYTDDVHAMGGVLRAIDLVDYVLYMVPMNALPPVPAIAGEGWREAWRERVESTPPWLLRWLREQHDGPYWRHGSLRLGPGGQGYERIEAATMLVGGWADGYRNNTFRTFEALRCPKRLLVGPWSHMAAETAVPGPPIDLTREMLRWFDHHLRGAANGVGDEDPVQLFVRRSTRPEPDLAQVRGAWRSEPTWPPARLVHQRRPIAPAEGVDRLEVRGDVGTTAWISCAGRLPWGQGSDQRPDEAWSLVDDWPPEAEPLELAGHVVVEARVRVSAPVAFLSAKLCDVFPDGTSALVTRGLVNLCHRGVWPVDPDGRAGASPAAVPVGEWVDVAVELEATSWVVEAGHHLRLDLAGADWPNTWPPPQPLVLEVDRAALVVDLPVLPPAAEHRAPDFVVPGRPGQPETADDPPVVWRFEHDVLGRETRAVIAHSTSYEGRRASRVVEAYEGEVHVSSADPGRAGATATARFEVAWPEGTAVARARLDLRSDAEAYEVGVELETTLDGQPFAARSWHERIERRWQ